MGELSKAVQQQSAGPEALILQYRGELASSMPSHVRADAWLSAAQTALRQNDKLREVAARNPASLMSALAEAAKLGHQPGSDHYYLVPYGNEVQGIEGYKGLIDRMYRTGLVSSVHARVVYERDEYSFRPGPNVTPDHVLFEGDDPGEMVRVYAYAHMLSGAISQVAVLSRKQVEENHRAHSKGWDKPSSPWKQHTAKMWLKSAVKEMADWVPLANEWRVPQPGVVDAEIVRD